MRLRTKLAASLVGLLILAGAYQVLNAGYTSQQVANPRGVNRALRDDGTRQVIVQAWWSPSSLPCDMQWRIGTFSQGSGTINTGTPRSPFSRAGWVKKGEPIILGWAMAPGPFSYIRYRVWLSGQVIKEESSPHPTMSITYTPW